MTAVGYDSDLSRPYHRLVSWLPGEVSDQYPTPKFKMVKDGLVATKSTLSSPSFVTWLHLSSSWPTGECDDSGSKRYVSMCRTVLAVKGKRKGRPRGHCCMNNVSPELNKTALVPPLELAAVRLEESHRGHEREHAQRRRPPPITHDAMPVCDARRNSPNSPSLLRGRRRVERRHTPIRPLHYSHAALLTVTAAAHPVPFHPRCSVQEKGPTVTPPHPPGASKPRARLF